MSLNATMIRERCVIKDAALGRVGSDILSNRLVLPIKEGDLVVRGQNMHTVCRFGAYMYKLGLDSSLSEQKENPEIARVWGKIKEDAQDLAVDSWIVVYLNGSVIFQEGEHHPFIDLIEKQTIGNDMNYDMNVMMASETFNAAGHPGMSVEHNSNVALILNLDESQGRCGLIYRHPRHTTTFSFTVVPEKSAQKLTIAENVMPVLHVCADFLESIQICYAIATDTVKGMGQDYAKQDTLKRRLLTLQKSIDGFEQVRRVLYRPERPSFSRFLQEAQILLAKRAR